MVMVKMDDIHKNAVVHKPMVTKKKSEEPQETKVKKDPNKPEKRAHQRVRSSPVK